MPPRPVEWRRSAWDFYVERCGHREVEGETPSDAARNAEEDVRRWVSLGGDAAFIAALNRRT